MERIPQITLANVSVGAYKAWKAQWIPFLPVMAGKPELIVAHMLASIQGEAQKAILGDVDALVALKDPKKVMDALDDVFLVDDHLIDGVNRLLKSGQRPNEHFQSYVTRIKAQLKDIFTPEKDDLVEYQDWNQRLQIVFFVLLSNEKMKRQLLPKFEETSTVDEIVQVGRSAERIMSISGHSTSEDGDYRRSNWNMAQREVPRFLIQDRTQPERSTQWQRTPWRGGYNGGRQPFNTAADRLGGGPKREDMRSVPPQSHRDSPLQTQPDATREGQNVWQGRLRPQSQLRGAPCPHCGIIDSRHQWNFCEKRKPYSPTHTINKEVEEDEEIPSIFKTWTQSTVNTALSPPVGTSCVDVIINGTQIRAVLDTGSEYTLMSARCAKKCGITVGSVSNSPRLSGAEGTPLGIEGTATLEVRMGKEPLSIPAFIVSNLRSQLLIGFNDLASNDIIVHAKEKYAKVKQEVIPLQPSAQPIDALVLDKTIFLPASSEIMTNIPTLYPDGTALLPEARTGFMKVSFVSAVGISNNGQLSVVIQNHNESPVRLPKGSWVGNAIEVTEVKPVFNTSEVDGLEEKNSLSEIGVDMTDTSLSEIHKIRLEEVLRQNISVFAKGLMDNGFCTSTSHRIPLNDQRQQPIQMRPYRVPYLQKKIIEDQVDKMLKAGTITQSASPWAAPAILVKKKGGDWRLCIDYRKLNDATKKDTFPIPRIDDTLESLKGCRYFSTLDLQNGYHQIAMAEEDKEKTAFVTHEGLYEFHVMPFGLSNAPATFQRLMNNLLRGFEGRAMAYLDDIIIYSKTFDEHCNSLNDVLQTLRKAGLKVKGSKCHFGTSRVNYLGYVVSQDGIHTDPDKVIGIQKFARPLNVSQLRSFLGLAGYYRRFVEKFSVIAEPLIQLTRKGIAFHWSEACEKAFSELKRKLTTAPNLSYPDFTKEFRLSTDASDYGIGAVLSQINEKGEDKAIAFASRTLNDAERNYATVEKEALAIVWAMQHYRHYLWGNRCKIITDHAPLRYLLRKQSASARLQRWALKLQEYNIIGIDYHRGPTNVVADALSRNPVSTALNIIQQEIIDHPGLQLDNICIVQRQDPELREIIEFLEDAEKTTSSENTYRDDVSNMFLEDGALWKMTCKDKTSGKDDAVLVIPKKLITEVLCTCHSEPLAGHFGFQKTWRKIKARFYWKKMCLDTKNFCDSCLPCQTRKVSQKPVVPMQPIEVNEPLSTWAMDICGPFPVSEDGNRYIIVFGDLFTKWIEAVPLKETSAATVARTLVDTVICRYGAPRRIISDQGSNFMSDLMGEVMEICNSSRVRTTAYHPQTNGFIERFNRTMAEQLSMYVSHDQLDWDKFLQPVVWAYRSAEQSSSGTSPFNALFGMEPRLPVDVACKKEQFHDRNSYAEKLILRLHKTRARIIANLEKARQMQRKYYDQKVNIKEFDEGDWILLKKPFLQQSGAKKLTHLYAGPFEVMSKCNRHNYVVRDPATNDLQKVNVQRLKVYKGEPNIDLWEDTREDAAMLKGEIRKKRGRPKKRSQVNDEDESEQEEIITIKGERNRTNKNGLTEKQYLVVWASDGSEEWKWARDVQAPRLLDEWTASKTTEATTTTDKIADELPTVVTESCNFIQEDGSARRTTSVSKRWTWTPFLILSIAMVATGSPVDNFFTLTDKPEFPIYLCRNTPSHYYKLPPLENCTKYKQVTRPTETFRVDIFAKPQAVQSWEACYCWRTEESCNYTMFFFGAKTSRCQSKFIAISTLECKSACQEKLSADGKLEETDANEYRTKNEIQETYAWPTTMLMETRNTWIQKIPLMIGNAPDYPVTAAVPLGGKCSVLQGHCSAFHHGLVMWNIPRVFLDCNLEKVGETYCEKYENIRCTHISADFDLEREVNICGKTLWKTYQGPYLMLSKQVDYPIHTFRDRIVKDQADAVQQAIGSRGQEIAATFQLLADRVEDARRDYTREERQLECEWRNRWILMVSNLLPIFPNLISTIIPVPHASVELHGDLVRISPCLPVTTYRILEDDPCVQEIPVEYQRNGKTTVAFLTPGNHHITSKSLKRKTCYHDKMVSFGNLSFSVSTRKEIDGEVLPMDTLRFAGDHWKHLVISQFSATPRDEGLIPLYDFASQVVHEHLEENHPWIYQLDGTMHKIIRPYVISFSIIGALLLMAALFFGAWWSYVLLIKNRCRRWRLWKKKEPVYEMCWKKQHPSTETPMQREQREDIMQETTLFMEQPGTSNEEDCQQLNREPSPRKDQSAKWKLGEKRGSE